MTQLHGLDCELKLHKYEGHPNRHDLVCIDEFKTHFRNNGRLFCAYQANTDQIGTLLSNSHFPWVPYLTDRDSHSFGIWIEPIQLLIIVQHEDDIWQIVCRDDLSFAHELSALGRKWSGHDMDCYPFMSGLPAMK